jgi:hypothetical protein
LAAHGRLHYRTPQRDQTKAGGASCLAPDRKTGIKKVDPPALNRARRRQHPYDLLPPASSYLVPRPRYLRLPGYLLLRRPVTLYFLVEVLLGILLAGLVRRVSFISSRVASLPTYLGGLANLLPNRLPLVRLILFDGRQQGCALSAMVSTIAFALTTLTKYRKPQQQQQKRRQDPPHLQQTRRNACPIALVVSLH